MRFYFSIICHLRLHFDMKRSIFLFAAFVTCALTAHAGVIIDEQVFGKSLGGWTKKDKSIAEYSLSGAAYRTYKPETSPTPDGGVCVSVRIDNVRGWLASDDHATLEITVNSKGGIVSAQSNIAIQGRSINSDVILGGTDAGKAILSPDFAVQVGADLVANLSAKLLRENIVEAGRVSFPAVLRHNFNHLFQAIRVEPLTLGEPVATAPVAPTTPVAPADPAKIEPIIQQKLPTPTPPKEPAVSLEIKPYH